jgi:chemosensory pili system protein ChpA (sensor histidine kinase/response regulator)
MELGVNKYLGKPYQDAVLLGLIAALLGTDAQSPAFCVDEVLFSP